MRICAACGSDTAKVRCSRCKSSFYCNAFCQSKDWGTHKRSCKLISQKCSDVGVGEALRCAGKPQSGVIMVKEVEGLGGCEKKAPTAEHFPPELRKFSYRGSGDGVDENLLLLFHGLGDTYHAFAQLGQKMELPQTATLAVSGPIEFPEEIIDGRAWFTAYDDNWDLLEPTIGDHRRILSLENTRRLLEKMIGVLCSESGWTRNRIHLLGFSQGGIVALDLAVRNCGPRRLGSVVAISSSILPEYLMQESCQRDVVCEGDCTSVLITHGNHDEVVARADVIKSKQCLKKLHPSVKVELHFVEKDHTMVRSSEEMRVLMKFWAEHMHRRMVNMEQNSTLYEVSSSLKNQCFVLSVTILFLANPGNIAFWSLLLEFSSTRVAYPEESHNLPGFGRRGQRRQRKRASQAEHFLVVRPSIARWVKISGPTHQKCLESNNPLAEAYKQRWNSTSLTVRLNHW